VSDGRRPDLSRLPPDVLALLRRAGELGAERGEPVWLVGGPVRDLCLGASNVDVDLAVEGDGPGFARALAGVLGGSAVVHDRFLTATIRTADLAEVDVVTARAETYERPGALPRVERADIGEDLRRRDFTVNAMAVALAPARFGELLDPLGGVADLAAERLRILHPRSFLDDPTRILRLARFAGRFGFDPDPETAVRLREALAAGALDTISADRLRHEVFLMFAEPEPAAGFARLAGWGALHAVVPGARPGAAFAEQVALANRVVGFSEKGAGWDPAVAGLVLLSRGASDAEREAAGRRLNLGPAARAALALAGRLDERTAAVQAAGRPSEIHRAVRDLPYEVQIAVLVSLKDPEARERMMEYLRRGRGTRPALDGNALQAMGYAPGPRLGAILEALHEAKLDGLAETPAAEAAWVRARFRLPDGAPVS
jgi:tRNA nucleotidyltransferase (CCA-adding enzyme)